MHIFIIDKPVLFKSEDLAVHILSKLMDLENTAQDYLAKVVGSKKKDPVVWTIYVWLSTKITTSRDLSRCIFISFQFFVLFWKQYMKWLAYSISSPLLTKVNLYGQKYTSTDKSLPLMREKYTFTNKNTPLLAKVDLYWQKYTSSDKSTPLLTKVHLYWQMYI